MRLWLAYTKADSHDVKCTHLHFLHQGKPAHVQLREIYEGPVVKCQHVHMSPVRKKGDVGPYKTESLAAYPSDMCKAIAEALLTALLARKPSVLRTLKSLPVGGDLSSTPAARLDEEESIFGKRLDVVEFIMAPKSAIPTSPTDTSDASAAPLNLVLTGTDKIATDLGPTTVPPTLPGGTPDETGLATNTPTKQFREPLPDFERPLPKRCKDKWEFVEGKDFVRAGWWGVGEPVRTYKGPGRTGRPMHDGGGLCSPGRWQPRLRKLPPRAGFIRDRMDAWIQTWSQLPDNAGRIGEDKCQHLGRFDEDPFGELLGQLEGEV